MSLQNDSQESGNSMKDEISYQRMDKFSVDLQPCNSNAYEQLKSENSSYLQANDQGNEDKKLYLQLIDLENKSTDYLQVIADSSDDLQVSCSCGLEPKSHCELNVINKNS